MPTGDIYRSKSTPQDIIKRALRLLNVLASSEPLPADMLNDGREALNDMLDAWNIDGLMIFVLSKNTFALTGGQNPHTIGPSANLDAPRPHRIEQGQAFLTGGSLGTNEEELAVITREQYAAILDKTVSSLPGALYYEPAMPLGKVWLDPKPDAAYTLMLYLETLFAQVQSSETATELVLPPGYKEGIVSNLAVRLAPEMGRSTPPEVALMALHSKTEIMRLNQRPLTPRGDPALCGEAQEADGWVDSRAFLTRGY